MNGPCDDGRTRGSTVPSIGRGSRRRPGRCSSPASSLRTGSRRHRISTVFQILGRRADSLRIGLYTIFLDTTGTRFWEGVCRFYPNGNDMKAKIGCSCFELSRC